MGHAKKCKQPLSCDLDLIAYIVLANASMQSNTEYEKQ